MTKPRQRTRSGAEWQQPFWRQRGWIVAALFLVLIGITALVNMISETDDGTDGGGGSNGAAAGTPSGASTPSGADGSDGTSTESCPEQTGGNAAATVPADLKWRELDGAFVPTSASDGPLRRSDTWSCFAHTPDGAVLAAHVIPSQMSGPRWRAAARGQLVVGPGQQEFIAARAALPDEETGAAPGELGSYSGFTVLDYAADRATVQLLVRRPDGAYVVTSVATAWQSGDWKVAPQSDGALTSAFVAVSDTTGFTLWDER